MTLEVLPMAVAMSVIVCLCTDESFASLQTRLTRSRWAVMPPSPM